MMPRLVNHDERRQLLAEAVCRVASRGGLEEVSLRHVAAEAGVSMGQVQHYFKTKNEMLMLAFEVMSGRVQGRIESAIAGARPVGTRDLLGLLLRAMLPLDDDSRLEAGLWVAFSTRAAAEEELRRPLRRNARQLLDFVAESLREAERAGELASGDPGFDADLEAASLLAVADGLMLHALLDEGRAGTAGAVVDYHLDRLFESGEQHATGATTGARNRARQDAGGLRAQPASSRGSGNG